MSRTSITGDGEDLNSSTQAGWHAVEEEEPVEGNGIKSQTAIDVQFESVTIGAFSVGSSLSTACLVIVTSPHGHYHRVTT